MAWANKYLFKFNSIHGVEYNIYILQDGYSGSVIRRALGRAPVLRKKQNGPICGTSLELWAQCDVDGEFAELYTSDPKEYKVEVYRANVLIWFGFVSTELYSEPSIAPPYDVQIVATDGLGELKLNSFEAQGEIALSELFVYILSFTGSDRDIHFAWDIKQYGSTVDDLLESGLIDLDYKEGDTLYEVLTYVLDSFHAQITAYNNVWLVTRETDLPSSGTSLDTFYIPAGGGSIVEDTLDDISLSAGKMGVADLWPVGNLSTSIEPARKAVTLNSPWHINNILENPNLVHSLGGWSLSDYVSWPTNVNVIEIGTTGHFAYIYQSFPLSYLASELRMDALVDGTIGSASLGTKHKLYFYVKYQTATATYYGDSDGWTEREPSSPRVPIDVPEGSYYRKYQKYEAVIPEPRYNEPGTLTFYIAGQGIYVSDAFLTIAPTYKGYRDTIIIDNGARGEDDEKEILHGRILNDEFSYVGLLSGAIKKVENGEKSYIYKFEDSHNSNADFLAITALSYALSVALPRSKREGILDIPSSLSGVPIFLTIESIRHLLETYDWDLYNEELKIVALSLPAASITVDSETVVPLDDSNYSGSGSGGSGGGSSSGGSSSGGVNMLKVWQSLTNNENLDSYDASTKIALEHISSFLELNQYSSGHYALKVKPSVSLNGSTITIDGLFTDGFLASGGIGSGGSGGGVDLDRVWESLTNNTDKPNVKIHTAHIPVASTSAIGGVKVDGSTIVINDGVISAANQSTGSVTSVALTVPTGLSVSGSPITSAGTLAITFANGYSIPTTAKQSNWDDAYTNSHTHSNQSTLDGISASDITAWDSASTNSHTHSNKSTLDGISASDITAWDSAATNSHTHSNKSTLDGISASDVTNWGTAYTNSHTHSNKSTLDGISASDVTHWNAAYGWGDHAGLYLPIGGGRLTGALYMGANSGGASPFIYWGDSAYVYIGEDADDHLQIKGDKGIQLLTGSSYGIKYGDAVLKWDSTNSAWHLEGNLYVDGFLASGGIGSANTQLVTLAGTQTITGTKTFSAHTNFSTAKFSSRVGIGTDPSSSYALNINGVCYATSYANSSDRRLKDKIETILADRALSVLMQLKPREWEWNDRNDFLCGKRSAGLVAQEVLDVLPFAISDVGDYLSMNYSVFHAYEIAGLQNHEKRIAALEEENKELKRRLGYVAQ